MSLTPRQLRELTYVRSRLGELERLMGRLTRVLTSGPESDKMAVDETCWADPEVGDPNQSDGAEPYQLPLGGRKMRFQPIDPKDPKNTAPADRGR